MKCQLLHALPRVACFATERIGHFVRSEHGLEESAEWILERLLPSIKSQSTLMGDECAAELRQAAQAKWQRLQVDDGAVAALAGMGFKTALV